MEVVVRFAQGKMQPEVFWLNGREYRVKDIALVWERSDGGKKYVCFSVDTGGALVELTLDRENFQFSITNFQSIP